jgi:Fur family transcriptional regulator, ferric uptake regulator
MAESIVRRKTRQAMSIISILENSDNPLTIQQILSRANHETNVLSLATVYRTIGKLLDEKRVQEISLPGSRSVYEINSSTETIVDKVNHLSESRHHSREKENLLTAYFECQKCKKVHSFPIALPATLDTVPDSFLVQSHLIFFTGLCPVCN